MKIEKLVWLAAILVPFALFFQVTQAYEYHKLETALRQQGRDILELQERNNQLRVGVGILESPSRLRQIAEEDLGLSVIESSRMIKVRIGSEAAGE